MDFPRRGHFKTWGTWGTGQLTALLTPRCHLWCASFEKKHHQLLVSVHISKHRLGAGTFQSVRGSGTKPCNAAGRLRLPKCVAARAVMKNKEQHSFTDPHSSWFDFIFICSAIFHLNPPKHEVVTLFGGTVFKIIWYQMSCSWVHFNYCSFAVLK